MRALRESIIGRRGSDYNLTSFGSLQYGDVVILEFTIPRIGGDQRHIGLYVPNQIQKKLFRNGMEPEDNLGSFVFTEDKWVVDYDAGFFKNSFPTSYDVYGNVHCRIIEKIGHFEDYRTIRSQKDARAVLEQYESDYETH